MTKEKLSLSAWSLLLPTYRYGLSYWRPVIGSVADPFWFGSQFSFWIGSGSGSKMKFYRVRYRFLNFQLVPGTKKKLLAYFNYTGQGQLYFCDVPYQHNFTGSRSNNTWTNLNWKINDVWNLLSCLIVESKHFRFRFTAYTNFVIHFRQQNRIISIQIITNPGLFKISDPDPPHNCPEVPTQVAHLESRRAAQRSHAVELCAVVPAGRRRQNHPLLTPQ